MSKMTLSKIACLIVAGMGWIVQYLPQAQDAVTMLHLNPNIGFAIAILGAICTSVLSTIHSHQLEQIQNATPGSPSATQPTGIPTATFVKTTAWLIGFMLLASVASAQVAYTQYDGGFKFANTSVPTGSTVNGTWFAPVALGNITPVVFNNGQLNFAPSVGVEAGYGLMIGSAVSDGTSLNIVPKFIAVPYIGDNAIQNGSIYVSNALVGIGIGVPSLLPNTLVGPSYNLANNTFLLSVSVFAGPLDFLGGTGVFKL